MTFNDLMIKVLQSFPNAELGEDNDGQIVIYTGLKCKEGSNPNVPDAMELEDC